MLAAAHRALAPVFQFLAACLRMLFHYPIVALQTLYCLAEGLPVKTHFIIAECLFLSFFFLLFALTIIFALANNHHDAKREKTLSEEIRSREHQSNRQIADKENQHRRHIAEKEARHLLQVQEIETREELMVGVVSDKLKNDQIHAALLKKLSQLVTLQEVDQAIERHMKVVSGSAEPPSGPYPAVSDTMAAFPVNVGVHMQLQINEAVARGIEQLKTSHQLFLSPFPSQETTTTPPTSKKASLSISSVSSTDTTSVSPPKNTLSFSKVVAQDTALVSPAKPVLSLSPVLSQDTTPVSPGKPALSLPSLSIQETEPLDLSLPKLSIGTILSHSTAPEQAQPPKLSMSKIETVSTTPLEVISAPLTISEVETVLEQAPMPCHGTADAAEAKQVVTQLLAVISGLKTSFGNLEGLKFQCITFKMDDLKHDEAVSVLKEFKRKVNMLFFGHAQNEDSARSDLRLATSENDDLKSKIDELKSAIDALKSDIVKKEEAALSELRLAKSEIDTQILKIDGQNSTIDGQTSEIFELKSQLEVYSGICATMQCEDYDEDLERFEQQLAEQAEQEFEADETTMTPPVTTGLAASATPFIPALSLPEISVTTQAHVAAATEEPIQALPPPPAVEKKGMTPPAIGLSASSFAPKLSLKSPSLTASLQTPTKVDAKVSSPTEIEPATVGQKTASSSGTVLFASPSAIAVSSKSPTLPTPMQSRAAAEAKVSTLTTVEQMVVKPSGPGLFSSSFASDMSSKSLGSSIFAPAQTPSKIEAKVSTPAAVKQNAVSSTGTGLFASSFASEVSSKPTSVPVTAQTQTATVVKAATPTPSTPKIEITEKAENGTHCDVCDVMVTISMNKHAEDCHGYCQICNQMVSGDWTSNRFSYDKHKELCRTTFKPKPEVKIPATPKPTAATSNTPTRTPKPPTTTTTGRTTKTFVCRHCHEDVTAPVITIREGHQIGDFSKHNITCRSERTHVKFYCVNCGMGVTNTDQFHAEHRAACQREASKIGNFRAFDMKTGLRIGESTEGLPPIAPRAMVGRTDGVRVTKAPAKARGPIHRSQHSTPVKGRGPMLGSQPSTPAKASKPKAPPAEHETRDREGASSSPAQPQWEGKVTKY